MTSLWDRFPEACKLIDDWNTAISSGNYMSPGGTNAPGVSWYYGTVIAHHEGWVQQKIYSFTSGTNYLDTPCYVRQRRDGTWGEWIDVTGSFNNAKNLIVSSVFGTELGLTNSHTWTQIGNAIHSASLKFEWFSRDAEILNSGTNSSGTSSPVSGTYIGVNIPINDWVYYQKAQIFIPGISHVGTGTLNANQVIFDDCAISENHQSEGYMTVRLRHAGNGTTVTSWTVVNVCLTGLYIHF